LHLSPVLRHNGIEQHRQLAESGGVGAARRPKRLAIAEKSVWPNTESESSMPSARSL
jgi:hypothetical protein